MVSVAITLMAMTAPCTNGKYRSSIDMGFGRYSHDLTAVFTTMSRCDGLLAYCSPSQDEVQSGEEENVHGLDFLPWDEQGVVHGL